MNVQKDQIQALIAEIDEVLSQPNLRLPWVVFGETVTRSRQVLERVRKYLVFLQQQVDEGAFLSPMETNQPTTPGMREPLWQAIRREMIYLRNHLTQPLQEEVERLRLEQRNLIQEIQLLEARKAQTNAPIQSQSYQQQLSREFLQEFMTRLQDSLIHNVTETLNHIETRFLDSILLTNANSLPALPATPSEDSRTTVSSLTPAQRLEQMRQLQAQSDHLLMTLDSSLSVIFEALQRNLQTYSDSLSQSLERMHSLGKQGEVMFTTLVNQLAQQVGQETSSYLQSSLQLTESEASINEEPQTLKPTISPPVSPEQDLSLTVEEFLPYAGAEMPKKPAEVVSSSPEMEKQVEPLETIQRFSAVEKESPILGEDELELTEPEPSFSLNWEEPLSFAVSSDVDAEFQALFEESEPEKMPISAVVEPEEIDLFATEVISFDEKQMLISVGKEPEEIDLLDEELIAVEELDEEDASEDVDTVFLDEETPTQDQEFEGIIEELDNNLDIENLFGDAETITEPIEQEEIVLESPNEAVDFFNLNSLDLFDESNSESSLDSQLPLTENSSQVSVSLESEDLLSEVIVAASPVTEEINPFEETLADLSDIFEEPNFEDDSPQNLGIVSARTQEMLTGIPSQDKSTSSQDEPQTISLEGDEYIQASPDENLLPISLEEDNDQIDSRLLIGRNTLEFLEADLFNLEQIESTPSTTSLPAKSSPQKSSNPQSPVSVQHPPLETRSKPTVSEEVITFEDLFRDIGMEPGSAQSVASLNVEPLNQKSSAETDNLSSLQSFSDLTLDDVFNSLNLAEEKPLRWNSEPEENFLSLEALSQEFHQ
ncbi:MAG: hypothetical protein ACKPEN_22180 [Planktothrix sp.]|uniref:hypothetical protein n=1 Tax=Planktothrix sp. TaxID=3088171 RepID=UPI0038D4F13F